RLLARHGMTVAASASVEEAERDHGLNDQDVILADLRLPGRAGTDIMSLAPAVPVIIMTSYASVRSAVTAMREGAIDYIAKPFDNDELLLVVQRAINESHLQRQNAAL